MRDMSTKIQAQAAATGVTVMYITTGLHIYIMIDEIDEDYLLFPNL